MDTESQMVYACSEGDLETLKTLIENGGDIHMILTDGYDRSRSNLLSIASKNNRINIVDFLIDNKLDIVSDFPILSITVARSYIDLFYFLINKIPDIDVNAKNIYGKTPLFYASKLKIFKELLNLGANPYHKDNDGKTFNSYVLPLSTKDEKELSEYIDTLNFDVKPAKRS
jgi:ankyrin repeat protein